MQVVMSSLSGYKMDQPGASERLLFRIPYISTKNTMHTCCWLLRYYVTMNKCQNGPIRATQMCCANPHVDHQQLLQCWGCDNNDKAHNRVCSCHCNKIMCIRFTLPQVSTKLILFAVGIHFKMAHKTIMSGKVTALSYVGRCLPWSLQWSCLQSHGGWTVLPTSMGE